MRQVIADFPGVMFVLAHGGRGHWYADAAALALAGPNVWIDLAGLPPKRLPDYYAGFDLSALARRWIFGTDWPGVPGVARNARAIAALGLPGDILAGVLSGDAAQVYLRGRRPPGRLGRPWHEAISRAGTRASASEDRQHSVRAWFTGPRRVSSRRSTPRCRSGPVVGRESADRGGGASDRCAAELLPAGSFSSASLPCLLHAVASSYPGR
jgi:hypothetical protein